MNSIPSIVITAATLSFGLFLTPMAWAGVATAILREVAESLVKKGARESAEDLGGPLARIAREHGAAGVEAVRRGGPDTFRYLAEGGEHGTQVVNLFEKYGDSAVHIVTRPKFMAIFLRHGDSAAEALLRHPGIADDLIEQLGAPGIQALNTVGHQNARRLAMLHQEGYLRQTGRADEILDVVARFGDRAMEFIWKHKGALAIGTTLAAFLRNPQAFIDGTVDLARTAVEPLANKAGDAGLAAVSNLTGTAPGVLLLGLAAVAVWGACGRVRACSLAKGRK